jgi:hypothetical protein
MNDDAVRSNTLVATLYLNGPGTIGDQIDVSGNRVITNGLEFYQGDNTVRVFELPPGFNTHPVQVHDFESADAGSAWSRSAQTAFQVLRVGNSREFRAGNDEGNPSAWLPTTYTTNQSVQGEVRIRSTNGVNAWAGLITRRTDAANYYYVTLRASGSIELKRRLNGNFTTLSSSPVPVQVGRKYRLRLESMGDQHRVYVDDQLLTSASDAALPEGTVGIATNRAIVDFDNVIVTPNWFTTIYRNAFGTSDDPMLWPQLGGNWQKTGGVLRQTFIGDYARIFGGARTDDQILQVRVRPTSFAAPDNWVGVFARWEDERNHLYVSLRGRGVVSLWRRTNGVIQQLATRALPVTAGTWYTLRVEIVNGQTRVFVDGLLQFATQADPGPTVTDGTPAKGQIGLITYKATADYDDFVAYQP